MPYNTGKTVSLLAQLEKEVADFGNFEGDLSEADLRAKVKNLKEIKILEKDLGTELENFDSSLTVAIVKGSFYLWGKYAVLNRKLYNSIMEFKRILLVRDTPDTRNTYDFINSMLGSYGTNARERKMADKLANAPEPDSDSYFELTDKFNNYEGYISKTLKTEKIMEMTGEEVEIYGRVYNDYLKLVNASANVMLPEKRLEMEAEVGETVKPVTYDDYDVSFKSAEAYLKLLRDFKNSTGEEAEDKMKGDGFWALLHLQATTVLYTVLRLSNDFDAFIEKKDAVASNLFPIIAEDLVDSLNWLAWQFETPLSPEKKEAVRLLFLMSDIIVDLESSVVIDPEDRLRVGLLVPVVNDMQRHMDKFLNGGSYTGDEAIFFDFMLTRSHSLMVSIVYNHVTAVYKFVKEREEELAKIVG